MERKSRFDSDHASKQSSSLQEAKSIIQRILDALSPFQPREIRDGDGRIWTLLAQESSSPLPTDAEAEWLIRGQTTETCKILAGTVNGLGLSGAAPDGKIANEWYEFAIQPNQRQCVLLTFEFEPTSYLRNFNEVDDVYAIDHGGVCDSYTMTLVNTDAIPDPVTPLVNPSTGAATTNGTAYVIVGYVGGGRPPSNSFLGPITINFCAPSSFAAFSPGA